MFYYLPNKRPVDVESAVDAMLDDNASNRYFLDVETGEVGCVDTVSKEGRSKLKTIQREKRRYRELPRVSEEIQKTWMGSFVRTCILIEEPEFGAALEKELHMSGFQAARAMLESSKEDTGWSWRGWAGDCAFEELGSWLTRNVSGTTYELKGCDDCAICRADKNGAGLGELLDAFEEQKQNDEDGPPQK